MHIKCVVYTCIHTYDSTHPCDINYKTPMGLIESNFKTVVLSGKRQMEKVSEVYK